MIGPSILYGLLVGAIVGLVWSFALDTELAFTTAVGAVVGVAIGIALLVFGKAAQLGGGDISGGERAFFSGSLLAVFGMVGTATGLVIWAVRVIFW
ncbi:MAG: hypothetical protein WEF53_12380 [Bacteroidota bacterium]